MGETVAYSGLLEGDSAKGILCVAERIAHDFGNLLMPLLEYPPLIKLDLAPGARAGGLLDSVVRTARDIEHISAQLAALSIEKTEHTPVDLNRVVSEVLRGASEDGLTTGVEVRCDLFAGIPSVRGDEQQLLNAVQCLVFNGLEELTRVEDTLTVSSSLCEHASWSVPAVRVSVTDTGQGVDPTVVSTIFDPFVTTKKRGRSKRGAGLGLSIAYVVARAHDGELRFESERGRGACFSLLIPAGA